MNYKPSFTEISSNEIQSWVNYGNPGETTKQNPNLLKIKVRVFYLHYFCPTRVNHVSTDDKKSSAKTKGSHVCMTSLFCVGTVGLEPTTPAL